MDDTFWRQMRKVKQSSRKLAVILHRSIRIAMKIDLHCHTQCSDGSLTPQALIELAKAQSVDVLSITDHDSVQAYDLIDHSNLGNMRLIPGIELSSQWSNRGIHVLGYFIDLNNKQLLNGIASQLNIRQLRAEKISAQLAKVGIHQSLSAAQELANGGAIGRPHFAQHLVNINQCKNQQQAFKQYLGKGKIADVKCEWPKLAEVVQWITQSGGIAVIAHPFKYQLNRGKLCRLLDDFIAAGGLGLEVLSGPQNMHMTQELFTLARQKGLHTSVGSDFHTPANTWTRLGMHSVETGWPQPVWQFKQPAA